MMSSDVVERNRRFLERIKAEDVSEDKIATGVGSFLMLLFNDEMENGIPLFFDFLSWYTGEDYSNELEWVQECLESGNKQFEEFKEMIEEHPLMGLLLALSD